MLNPEVINKINDTYNDGGETVLSLPALVYFDRAQYDLLDDKSYKKYMTDIERTVRNSFEYRQLISYLKNTEGMDVCSFLDGVTSRDNTKVKIELHHYPFTLFDICMAVYKKREHNCESISVEDVAEEVMFLHYIGWVGLIPLSSTVHTMYHNNYLFIPTNKVRGNYKLFKERFYNFISPDVLDAVDTAEQMTDDYSHEKQKEIFNNHNLYINADGSYALPRKREVNTSIRQRIDTIKSGLIVMACLEQ